MPTSPEPLLNREPSDLEGGENVSVPERSVVQGIRVNTSDLLQQLLNNLSLAQQQKLIDNIMLNIDNEQPVYETERQEVPQEVRINMTGLLEGSLQLMSEDEKNELLNSFTLIQTASQKEKGTPIASLVAFLGASVMGGASFFKCVGLIPVSFSNKHLDAIFWPTSFNLSLLTGIVASGRLPPEFKALPIPMLIFINMALAMGSVITLLSLQDLEPNEKIHFGQNICLPTLLSTLKFTVLKLPKYGGNPNDTKFYWSLISLIVGSLAMSGIMDLQPINLTGLSTYLINNNYIQESITRQIFTSIADPIVFFIAALLGYTQARQSSTESQKALFRFIDVVQFLLSILALCDWMTLQNPTPDKANPYETVFVLFSEMTCNFVRLNGDNWQEYAGNQFSKIRSSFVFNKQKAATSSVDPLQAQECAREQ